MHDAETNPFDAKQNGWDDYDPNVLPSEACPYELEELRAAYLAGWLEAELEQCGEWANDET